VSQVSFTSLTLVMWFRLLLRYSLLSGYIFDLYAAAYVQLTGFYLTMDMRYACVCTRRRWSLCWSISCSEIARVLENRGSKLSSYDGTAHYALAAIYIYICVYDAAALALFVVLYWQLAVRNRYNKCALCLTDADVWHGQGRLSPRWSLCAPLTSIAYMRQQ
jgi:hypothetical protein